MWTDTNVDQNYARTTPSAHLNYNYKNVFKINVFFIWTGNNVKNKLLKTFICFEIMCVFR